MSLPNDIKARIAEYLNLEFGEDSFNENNLRYAGEKMGIFYWNISGEKSAYWATVEPYENSYLIGISSDAPNF